MSTSSSPPRYCPDRALPPYSYVPGRFPHPQSDPLGHSFGRHEPPAAPLSGDNWQENETWLYAIDLFNGGFYWEAHEAWEALWHAAGRKGATADFLKGLIKLAAAGVKACEGRAAGVRQHATRAAELLLGVGDQARLFGVDVPAAIAAAQRVAAEAVALANSAPSAKAAALNVQLGLIPAP